MSRSTNKDLKSLTPSREVNSFFYFFEAILRDILSQLTFGLITHVEEMLLSMPFDRDSVSSNVISKSTDPSSFIRLMSKSEKCLTFVDKPINILSEFTT